ncbi:MAG TPA: hypothetical protein VG734_08725 [Lacunisphaera sp.]|nr:hypothetical protein [Lacunisphaera sp.]
MLAAPEPFLLVGGQAVNLWALYFQDETKDYAPFVSRDADILGDRDTLARLGKRAGRKPQYFPLRPPTNEVGVVIATDSAGVPMLIEVLRHVKGASDEELRQPVYRFSIGEPPAIVETPGPIVLLQAKVANLAELDQRNRQDGRHILILNRLMPSYLATLRDSAAGGRLDERMLIKLLEQLLKIILSTHGRKASADLDIDPQSFFTGLNPAGLPKLQAFLEKRLPRALAG